MFTKLAPFLFIRFLSFLISLFPYSFIHKLGNFLGLCIYYCHPKFRKRTLSNLALASDLHLKPDEVKRLAKKSFQNVAITFLEFGKLSKEKHLERIVTNVNPEKAETLLKQKQGIIFFVGHQANWELLFLDGIWRFKDGAAIARPMQNERLYRYIKSVRERFGGKIIDQKRALKEGLRALKSGIFLGIVGDQGMPESPFSNPFLGRMAYTSSAPALLAYKTNSPIIVATIHRNKGHYTIQYSDPIYPNLQNPVENESQRLMKETLSLFEKSIIAHPDQWLWQHNRWKQETPKALYYRFRMDSVLIVLPKEEKRFLPLVKLFRQIYPKAFLSFCLPNTIVLDDPSLEIIHYKQYSDLYFQDYRFKLVFNFTNQNLKKHFLKQSAQEVLTLDDLHQVALDHEHIQQNKTYTDEEIVKRALCRPGTFWTPEEKTK